MKKAVLWPLFVLAAVLLVGCRAQQTPAASGGDTETMGASPSMEGEAPPVSGEAETLAATPTQALPDTTEKHTVSFNWDQLSEEDKDTLLAVVVNSLKALDAQTLAPYIGDSAAEVLNTIKKNPEMCAIYQSLMDRVTYENNTITGPSIKYLLGSWWMEHSHDDQEVMLSNDALGLFELSYTCPTVSYNLEIADCIKETATGEKLVDIDAVFHPLGIAPSYFTSTPENALAAETEMTISGRHIAETLPQTARNMEGYLQANLHDMVVYIEDHRDDFADYSQLATMLDDVDMDAACNWAKGNVLTVCCGTNIYYYVRTDLDTVFTYYELLPISRTDVQNDVQIVKGIVEASQRPVRSANPVEMSMDQIKAALGFGYKLPDVSENNGEIVSKLDASLGATGGIQLEYTSDDFGGVVYVIKYVKDEADLYSAWRMTRCDAGTETFGGVEVRFLGSTPETRRVALWEQDGFGYLMSCETGPTPDIMTLLPLFIEK